MVGSGGWLDAEGAAKHLSIKLDAFRRKVAEGVLPKPSYALGPRTPRWSVASLDVVMDPGIASTDVRTAVDALAQEIEAEGEARRQRKAERGAKDC